MATQNETVRNILDRWKDTSLDPYIRPVLLYIDSNPLNALLIGISVLLLLLPVLILLIVLLIAFVLTLMGTSFMLPFSDNGYGFHASLFGQNFSIF